MRYEIPRRKTHESPEIVVSLSCVPRKNPWVMLLTFWKKIQKLNSKKQWHIPNRKGTSSSRCEGDKMAQQNCIPTEPCYVTKWWNFPYHMHNIYISNNPHPPQVILLHLSRKLPRHRHLWVVNASAMPRLRDYSWPHVPLVPPWPSPVRTVARWSGPGGWVGTTRHTVVVVFEALKKNTPGVENSPYDYGSKSSKCSFSQV